MRYVASTLLLLCFATSFLFAQPDDRGVTVVNGQYFEYMVDDCGDTLILASLEGISVSSLRTFESDEDYRRYRRYRQYALKVYPYARQAIRIFRETQYVTENMNRRQARRYIRRLQRELKREFADPLKNLSKTQGHILIKMIERELDVPMFDLIKQLRGGITASYWNTMSKLFGHNLRDGYVEGTDIILDAVLDDFDVSYQVPEGFGQEEEEGEE